MTAASSGDAFYVTGGPPPVASSCVERAADRELLSALVSGEDYYVLNSRQMGKSSLCVRTIQRLQEDGIRTSFLDLRKFGGRNLTAERFLRTAVRSPRPVEPTMLLASWAKSGSGLSDPLESIENDRYE